MIQLIALLILNGPAHRYFKDPAGVTFVYVPPGDYEMGNQNKPLEQHKVQLSGFWISITPITNKQFEHLMPHHKRGKGTLRNNQPATNITFADAMNYARLSQVKFGNHYRLPTAAEWEYAARAGEAKYDFPWGNSEKKAPQMSDYTDVSPANVPSFPPNRFGLYNVTCEVEEWVLDDFFDGFINFKHRKEEVNPLFLNYNRHTNSGIVKSSYWGIFAPVFSFGFGYRDMGEKDCDFYGFRLVMTKQPTKFTKVFFKEHTT